MDLIEVEICSLLHFCCYPIAQTSTLTFAIHAMLFTEETWETSHTPLATHATPPKLMQEKKFYFNVNASKRRIKYPGHTFWLYVTLGRLQFAKSTKAHSANIYSPRGYVSKIWKNIHFPSNFIIQSQMENLKHQTFTWVTNAISMIPFDRSIKLNNSIRNECSILWREREVHGRESIINVLLINTYFCENDNMLIAKHKMKRTEKKTLHDTTRTMAAQRQPATVTKCSNISLRRFCIGSNYSLRPGLVVVEPMFPSLFNFSPFCFWLRSHDFSPLVLFTNTITHVLNVITGVILTRVNKVIWCDIFAFHQLCVRAWVMSARFLDAVLIIRLIFKDFPTTYQPEIPSIMMKCFYDGGKWLPWGKSSNLHLFIALSDPTI